ncbi:MAG TPA: hypothetical protein VLM38_16655 [Blastocatellia bacterium]|nr:hypothetical protein [Blastocatellia bacterium]
MKRMLLLFAMCVIVSTALQTAAQQPASMGPPRVLSIFREEIKAGRGAAHQNLETGYVRALQRAKWPVFSLAMTPAVGGTDAWFITAYDSFAALEKDRQNSEKNAQMSADFDRLDALDADFRTGQRSIVCVLNEALSFGGNFDVSQMRYFSVTTVRVRPGHDQEYQEARKILVEALMKANPNAHSVLYSVSAGMPNGTYLIFTPRKSLAEMDPNPAMAKAVQDAMGDDNSKKRQKLLADSVISSEVIIYGFSPKMSYVPKEWAKTGGEFWTPKAPARAPAAKKPAAQEKPAEKKGL